MATQNSSTQGSRTLTVVEVLEGAFNFPQPTLRLRRQSPDEIERKANETLEQLLNNLEKALDKNSEDLRAFLKSLVPKREEFSTDEAYEQALQDFKSAMPTLQLMMQEQSVFTAELLDKVKAYLIESWKMMCDGASDDDMRIFRKKHREEACNQFDDRAKEIKEKMADKVRPSGMPTPMASSDNPPRINNPGMPTPMESTDEPSRINTPDTLLPGTTL